MWLTRHAKHTACVASLPLRRSLSLGRSVLISVCVSFSLTLPCGFAFASHSIHPRTLLSVYVFVCCASVPLYVSKSQSLFLRRLFFPLSHSSWHHRPIIFIASARRSYRMKGRIAGRRAREGDEKKEREEVLLHIAIRRVVKPQRSKSKAFVYVLYIDDVFFTLMHYVCLNVCVYTCRPIHCQVGHQNCS